MVFERKGGHDEHELMRGPDGRPSGQSPWRLVVALISLVLLLARCGLDANQDESWRDNAVSQLQNSLEQQSRTPVWHGCPIDVGVNVEAMGAEMVGPLRAAALDISERTDFPLSVTENPESSRLWVTRAEPAETDTSDATGVTTFVQHTDSIVTSAVINVSPTVPPDRLEWELRRALGHLLVGQADFTMPPQLMGNTSSSLVEPTGEPPYDVEAVRAAGDACTSMEEIAGAFGPLEWRSCPTGLAVAADAPNGSLAAISTALAQLEDSTGWGLTAVNGTFGLPVMAFEDGTVFVDVDADSVAPLVVAWADTATIAGLSATGSTTPGMLTAIRRDEADIVGGAVLIDRALTPEQVTQGLPGALARLAVGDADVIADPLAEGIVPTTAAESASDQPFDADAVRGATAAC